MKQPKDTVIALCLVLAFMAESRAQDRPQPVRLVIAAQFSTDSRIGEQGLVHGNFPIARAIHPFRKLAARLMSHAGVRLAGDGVGLLHIEAQGLALGTLYDFMENSARLRHLRFTGATIEGSVSLTSERTGRTCAARFAGTIDARKGGLVVGVWDYREAPYFAPFDKALREPESFVAALMAVIATVYDAGPLSAARADPGLGAALDEPLPAVECATP